VTDETWSAVDRYITEQLVKPDPVFDEILERSRAAGLPAISVSPAQGKFLQLLVSATGARDLLEVGTLGGYSATWMARGLQDGGRLLSIELESRHANVARENFTLAGVADRIEVLVGSGATVMERLAGERPQSFDLIFIDADKGGYPDYFRFSMSLARPGGLIVADNVVRGGKVIDQRSREAEVLGIRRFYEAVAAEPRATATTLQTVGVKGYDGLAIIRVDR
jgi:predicted O-methyltransferase YrrM